MQKTKKKNLALKAVEQFDSPTGKGVIGGINQQQVALGNQVLMDDLAVDTSAFVAKADNLRADGATVIYMAIDQRVAGLLVIKDPIKATSAQAVKALQAAGIHVIMLTGDNKTSAMAVARELGIDEVQADVLPEDKGRVVQRLQEQGRIVAMAGDGTNEDRKSTRLNSSHV